MTAIGTAFVRFGAALVLTPAMFVVGSTVSGATTPTAPPSTVGSVDLDAAVEEFVGDEDGGAVVLVVRDGVTTTATAGMANSAGEPMTAATAFRVGSLTKPFVATLVLQLVDEGLVDLDEALSSYLPDTPLGGDVTIRALLRHRSGLPSYTENDDFREDIVADLAHVFTPDEILGYVDDLPVDEPDQRSAYSDTNFILLGQLIERLEATDLSKVLDDRISGALGLDATHLAMADAPVIDGLAGGWYPGVVDGDPTAVYDSITSAAWAAAALVSTTDELHSFLAALFRGELISNDALAEMTDSEPDGYGLGLGTLDLASGTRLYGHSGELFGYLSFMAIEPNTGDTIIILTNNSELQPSELAEPILADW